MNNDDIISQVAILFAATDERDWQKVRSVLAPTVLVDYSALGQGAPESLTPEQLTERWAAVAPGFDSTLHEPSDFEVAGNDREANVHFRCRATHVLGNEEWVLEAAYDMQLYRIDGQWRITMIRVSPIRQSGNIDLAKQAAEVVKRQNTANG